MRVLISGRIYVYQLRLYFKSRYIGCSDTFSFTEPMRSCILSWYNCLMLTLLGPAVRLPAWGPIIWSWGWMDEWTVTLQSIKPNTQILYRYTHWMAARSYQVIYHRISIQPICILVHAFYMWHANACTECLHSSRHSHLPMIDTWHSL